MLSEFMLVHVIGIGQEKLESRNVVLGCHGGSQSPLGIFTPRPRRGLGIRSSSLGQNEVDPKAMKAELNS